MITKKTVLVLGAGASKPYGYPTGTELKNLILNYNVEEKRDHGPVFSYIIEKFSEEHCLEFYKSLKWSSRQSVNTFLEHRQEFVDLGKALMSFVLIPSERKEFLFQAKNNWYEYFYTKLNARFEDFTTNNVSIITFNYDRSFEQHLLTAIQKGYGKTEKDVADVLKSIPIIHLYGNLGDLPALTQDKKNAREYSQEQSPENIEICINNIKIIHEGIEDNPQFSQAHQLLSEAEIICFLGFGYDKTNLDRLRVREIFVKADKEIFGSAKGLTPKECMNKVNYITGNIEIDYEGYDTLRFLRKYSPFDL